jgi:beta-glucosidase
MTKTPIFKNIRSPLEKRIADLLSKLTLEEKISQLIYINKPIERLGIKEYNWWSECLHGVGRAGVATVFPQAIALAATFNPDLIYDIATAISDEARAKYNLAIKKNKISRYFGLTFYSPNINIFRDPRWGRGQETYGEDPHLVSSIAVNFVKGLQGNNKKYLKIAACAKHFAVHSGPESLRHNFDAIVSKKDLFETYLPSFKALVDADVEGFMPAYNKINGIPCSCNKYLLVDILRNLWGFKGYTTSDGWALNDIHEDQKYTSSPEETAIAAITNGCNMELGSTENYLTLVDAVKNKKLDEKIINDALFYVLKTKFKLGLFDPHNKNPYSKIKASVINCKKHKKLAKKAAIESIVLLKNKNNILPLSKDINNLGVVGPHALNTEILLGNYHGLNSNMPTILESIVGKLNKTTSIYYNHSILSDRKNPNPIDWSFVEIKKTDVTIVVAGLTPLLEGEEGDAIASDSLGDRKEIGLPIHQVEYIKKICSAGKPVVVVLTGGSPMSIPEIHDIADAILYVWYPGECGGEAIADILFGDAVPSGKLPFTVPSSMDHLPDFTDYSMVNRTYKYAKNKPLYPFGFGLSYTDFYYDDLNLKSSSLGENESLIINFVVKNIGNRAAFETVQIYISCLSADFRVPIYELKAFKKIFLKAGEEKKINFIIDNESLKSINENGEKVLIKGNYRITIGGCSPGNWDKDLQSSNELSANFKII